MRRPGQRTRLQCQRQCETMPNHGPATRRTGVQQCHMPAHSQRPCQTVHTAVAPTRLPRGVSQTRLTPLCIPWRPISPLDRAWLVRSRGEISNSLPRTFIISGLWIPSRVPGLPSCLRRALSSCARRTRDGDSWVKLVPSLQSVCMTASSQLRAVQTPHRCRQPAALPTACAGNGGTQSLRPDQTLARAFRAPCGGLGRPDGRGVRKRGGARGGIRVHAAYPS